MAYIGPPMVKRSTWSNCGLTCANIIELGGNNLVRYGGVNQFTAQDAQSIFQLLTSEAGFYRLFDIAFYDIHEFMIDLAPNGGRSLVQGYSNNEGYSALWWCGASNNNASLTMRPQAEAWGKGADIRGKFRTLAEGIRNLLSCGTWGGRTPGGTTAIQVWKTLPFLPSDSRVAHWAQTNAVIRVQLDRYRLTGPMPAVAGSAFYSPRIVIQEAAALGVHNPW